MSRHTANHTGEIRRLYPTGHTAVHCAECNTFLRWELAEARGKLQG